MTRIRRLVQSCSVLIVMTLFAPAFARQQTGQGSGLLALDNVFSYQPKSLGEIRWQQDGTGYLQLEPSSNGALDLVRYDATTGAKTVSVPASRLVPKDGSAPIVIEEFDFSADERKLLIFANSERVWRSNTRGDYWVLDLTSWDLHRLGGNAKPSSLMFAKFSPDGNRVGYVRENNLFVEDLAGGGAITQLTNDGTVHIANGTFDWVYEEELFCRDGWRWSPDGKNIAYWQLDSDGVKEFTLINDTAGLYPVLTTFPYPVAGETNSAARVGVVRATGSATRWFDVPGDPRDHYLPRMEWAGNSSEVIIQQLNRLQNTNIVMLGDASTGHVRPIMTEKDDAWVDVSWGDIDWDKKGLARGDAEWIDNGNRFLWSSERDGWRHIYSISRDGNDVRCVTKGDFDVITVEGIDKSGGWLYFHASPDDPKQRYLYRAALDGSRLSRLTPDAETGSHAYDLSPKFDLAIHTYSAFNKVPVTEIVKLPGHTGLRTIIDNKELRDRLALLKPCGKEFFRVDIGEGVKLDGWMIKPPDFDPKKRYPVLFYVYGEPWGQTVQDAWGIDDMMWHTLLAQRGYIVMSVDNRGTPAPRGRAWRKSIYRKMGVLNSSDQANAVKAIRQWPFVDPSRIGIWGWSGGGTSSLNAIFRYPDLYQVAMAVAPVPDIRYYDSIYQERYCALPKDHPDEYKQEAALTFAGQLKGRLLIVHGTGDDNVHYQGTEALINALVAANKPFTMMAYPNRSHGIFEGPGTRRHLFELLTRFLMENLPTGNTTVAGSTGNPSLTGGAGVAGKTGAR
jgi:dipeptidyl-peptidase-4